MPSQLQNYFPLFLPQAFSLYSHHEFLHESGTKMKTAQILIVGNEILSGRTLDTNTQFLARALNVRGVRVTRGFCIPDDIQVIRETVRANHGKSDYFFVCGGIGGTPDDVTREAVALACDTELELNPVAEKLLRDFYKDRINDERLAMAFLPKGASLINNPHTKAPGFKIKNIYVFAGIPKLVEAMFSEVAQDFQGSPLFEKEELFHRGEGDLGKIMKQIVKDFPDVELGSYPQVNCEDFALPMEQRKPKTLLILKGQRQARVEEAFETFMKLVHAQFPS